MLTPLILMLIACHGYFALVVILRMRALITARRIANLELKRLGSNGGVT
jgi:hypothetical protein